MVTNFKDHHIVVGDHFINENVSRVVEAIHDYEPLIEVQFIPPQARAIPGQRILPAFKLVYHNPDGPDYTLFHVEDEAQFDQRVLQRIIVNDQRNGKSSLSDYEAWEESQRLIAKQAYLDKIEEAADIAAHVLKTHKNDYRVSADIRFKEGIPFNVAKRKD